MKLHLPKALLMATLMAFVAAPVYAETESDYTAETENPEYSEGDIEPTGLFDTLKVPSPDAEGNYHYQVGSQTTKYDYISYQKDLTLNNHDTLGIYNAEGKLITTGFGDCANGDSSGDAYTNDLLLTAIITNYNLTLNDYSIVALGGQYKDGNKDIYNGITAAAVTINDNAKLILGRANFSSLSANGSAYVSIHGNNSGNSGHAEYTGGNELGKLCYDKQAYIKGDINVSNHAQVILGVDNGQNQSDLAKHYLNNINGSITQTSDENYTDEISGITYDVSSLNIKGKTYISGNLKINQSGGNMEIAAKSAFIRLAKSTNNSIAQTTGGTMKIGQLVCGDSANSNSQVTIEQQGSGTIELVNGVKYTSSSDSSIWQTSTVDKGTIKLTGDFTSARFDITQDGNGSIEVNGNMALDAVTQNAGKLSINSGKSVSVNSMKIGGTLINNGTITGGSTEELLEIVGGKVENNGIINMSIALMGGELTALGGSTFAAITATSGTIYLNGAVSIESLTLGSEANVAGLYTLRSTPQGVVVYVGEDGIDATNIESITMLDNVTFVVQKENGVDDLSEPVTIFRNGNDAVNQALSNGKVDIVVENTTTGAQSTPIKYTNNGNGSVSLESVPEPTTATLSLLALAALAARRRRR